MRVGSERLTPVGAERITSLRNDARADRADHTAPASHGPFRAALKAAGKPGKPDRAAAPDDAATAAAQVAQQRADRQDTPPVETLAPNHVNPGPTATATQIARSSELVVRLEDALMTPTSTDAAIVTATSARSAAGATADATTSEALAPPTRTGAGTDPPPAGTAIDAATLAALGLSPSAATPGAPIRGTQVAAITPATPGMTPASAMLAGSVHPPAAKPEATPPTAPALTAMPAGLDALPTMTPLEQAVHDLISRVVERDTAHVHGEKPIDDDAADPALAPFHLLAQTHVTSMAHDAAAPASPAAHAAAPVQLPEPPANPSHVHLVIDDGAERTVVTVAVRGNDVHVAMRSTDDATGNNLARNAASLDHAMRARGLALAELTSEREPSDRRPPKDPEPRERREPTAEPFKLEETP